MNRKPTNSESFSTSSGLISEIDSGHGSYPVIINGQTTCDLMTDD